MLHKRYNYKRPLILVVIFFVVVLRTNTISPDKIYLDDLANKASIASGEPNGDLAMNSNFSRKTSFLFSLYHQLILQFKP